MTIAQVLRHRSEIHLLARRGVAIVVLVVSTAAVTVTVTAQTPGSEVAPGDERGRGVVALVEENGNRAKGVAAFMKIRAPSRPTVGPDRALYVIDWPDGVNQLYRRERAVPSDGSMLKLTDLRDGINDYALSPNGRTIIVSAAVGGSEQNDLYRMDTPDGDLAAILADPSVVYGFQRWLADGSGFIYTANDDSPADFHVYRYDLATGASTTLSARAGYWVVADVTEDGRRLLLTRYHSVSHAEAFELNAITGTLRGLDIAPDAFNTPVFYLPGENEVAVISDAEEGITRLFTIDLESGARSKPMPDLDPFPIESGSVNEHRSLGVVLHNEGGYSTPRVVSLPTFAVVPLPPIEKGIAGDFDLRGRYATWTLSNARTPGLSYICKIGRTAEAFALTEADDQGIDLSRFTLPQLISYESFDSRAIPAFLYTPPAYEPGERIPFVVMFHGGPEGQSRPGFSRTVQYLLSRGYGVMQPNVRGSTGYGRAFHRLDDYRNRWDSVRDGAAAARWLVSSGHSAPGRIAAFGGSYGGFMAVASVIEAPDVFGASIDVVGIVNFQTFLEQTKDYRRKLREAEYGPLDDPDFLRSISPIHRIDEIKVPMLIAHGLNDPRVPVGEAMQLAIGLQKRGYDPELLFFPDEGHGFAKLENRLLFYERVAEFLDREIGE